jgi:hypothetical protein
MRWLLFLSRLAFICGVCFLISLVFLMMNRDNVEPFSQTIIMIGYAFGLVVVPVTIICYAGVLVSGKKLTSIVPRWLVLMNVLFLFVLLFYIFYLNDPYYHQK